MSSRWQLGWYATESAPQTRSRSTSALHHSRWPRPLQFGSKMNGSLNEHEPIPKTNWPHNSGAAACQVPGPAARPGSTLQPNVTSNPERNWHGTLLVLADCMPNPGSCPVSANASQLGGTWRPCCIAGRCMRTTCAGGSATQTHNSGHDDTACIGCAVRMPQSSPQSRHPTTLGAGWHQGQAAAVCDVSCNCHAARTRHHAATSLTPCCHVLHTASGMGRSCTTIRAQVPSHDDHQLWRCSNIRSVTGLAAVALSSSW